MPETPGFREWNMTVATRQRLLVFGQAGEAAQTLLDAAGQVADVSQFTASTPLAAADSHATGSPLQDAPSALLFVGDSVRRLAELQWSSLGLLDAISDGIVVLDDRQCILWHNGPFATMIGLVDNICGSSLSDVLGLSEQERAAVSTMTTFGSRVGTNRHFVKVANRTWLGLRASRCDLVVPGGKKAVCAMTVRDVTVEILERQKQEAIYKAGLELGNLTPDDVTGMSHDDRITLLKENILHFTEEILGYDTFEIRLLNPETEELVPLLEFGMDPEAAARQLFARPEGNGVTGFVAHSGSSYLCHDTKNDVRYLCGAADARSSLTVPLMLHDKVLGTFNVESPGTLSFDERDLEFLALFGRVVANALNQLQLLVAEKVTTATASSDRLRREISEPTDEILRDATWIMERYIGHDPDVFDGLQRIVAATRRISGQVEEVSQSAAPATGLPSGTPPRAPRPALVGKRILVVDSEPIAREDAHTLLGQMGCRVEEMHR